MLLILIVYFYFLHTTCVSSVVHIYIYFIYGNPLVGVYFTYLALMTMQFHHTKSTKWL